MIYIDVDAAVTVPVNIMPLTDDTDFKTRETAIAYNEAGMDLVWNFVTPNGTITQTAVTPTTAGDYDWTHIGDGMYKIEIPASGGASINNDTEGVGYFTGVCTGVLPWRGPDIVFRAAGINDKLIESPYDTTRGLAGTALPAAAADAAGGLVISDAGGADIDTLISTVNTTSSNVTTVDTVVDAIKVVTDAIPDSGSLTTITTHLTQIKGTGFVADTHSLTNIEGYADLIDDGTSGLAKIATDVAAILVDTADIQPKLGTVSDLGGGATVAANLSDLAGATFSTATDSLEAIRDRGDAAWTTGAGGTPPDLLQSTTIATLASQTSFTLTAGSADDDAYNGHIAIVTDSATSTQKAVGTVSDYTGSTKTITLAADPAIFTMAVGDTIEIVAATGTGPTAAAIRAEIDSNSTQLAAIVADTNELQTDWANGGRLDLIVDAILDDTDLIDDGTSGLAKIATDVAAVLVDTGTTLPAAIPSAATVADAVLDEALAGHVTAGTLGKAIADIETDATAILADTSEIQGDLADGGRLDLIFDAILVDTGTTVPAQISALNNLSAAQVNAEVVDVLATDTYAELGAVPAATSSLAAKLNWVFMLSRNKLTQTATTQTVYADDGTTSVATSTVADDGTTFTKGEAT